MKNAIWLFLYLLLSADRKTGILKRKIQTIGLDMGVSRTTICRWLAVLRRTRYIVTRNSGHCLTVQIERWKPLPGIPNLQQQMFQSRDTRYSKFGTPKKMDNLEIPDYFGPKTVVGTAANEKKINILKRNERQNGLGCSFFKKGFTDIGRCAQQEVLALELATALDDTANMRRYRDYAQKYSERLLREVLQKVLITPTHQSSQERGRKTLFNLMMQQYVPRTFKDSGY